MTPAELDAIEKEQRRLLIGDYRDIGAAKAELNYHEQIPALCTALRKAWQVNEIAKEALDFIAFKSDSDRMACEAKIRMATNALAKIEELEKEKA